MKRRWPRRLRSIKEMEKWNQYLLDDGSLIKMKPVATKVLRVEGKFDEEGSPVYLVKSTNIMSVSAPDSLKRK